jgi:hypothetical protein
LTQKRILGNKVLHTEKVNLESSRAPEKDAASDRPLKSFIVSQFTFLSFKAATQVRDIAVWWRSEMLLILPAKI